MAGAREPGVGAGSGAISGIPCADQLARPVWPERNRGTPVAPAFVTVPMRSPLLVSCCAAALAALGTEAQPPADRTGSAFTSRVSLVPLTVTVEDARARDVTYRQPQDFAIYEDGVQTALYVALQTFAAPDAAEGSVRRQALAVLSDGSDTASGVSFDSSAHELASQYSIGDEPVDRARPAGHRVDVTVVNRPELRACTRTGYSDDRRRVGTP